MRIKLSSSQLKWLKVSKVLPSDILNHLECIDNCDDIVLDLAQEVAESIADILTQTLAKVGFDESYELTEEGEILEVLIERFTSY